MRLFYLVVLMVCCSSAFAQVPGRTPSFPDTEEARVHFYPNPAISYITFDLQKDFGKNYSIQIFNFLGKKVYEFVVNDAKTVVNLSDFFRGIYIFQLKDPNGKVIESGKFQVNK
ncbi:MAG TPA: T9SS type A sorting domain-containing protein [Puia sp.]|nr:T9SS type A sorting domain-containing protein [Puia sp.]